MNYIIIYLYQLLQRNKSWGCEIGRKAKNSRRRRSFWLSSMVCWNHLRGTQQLGRSVSESDFGWEIWSNLEHPLLFQVETISPKKMSRRPSKLELKWWRAFCNLPNAARPHAWRGVLGDHWAPPPKRWKCHLHLWNNKRDTKGPMDADSSKNLESNLFEDV